MSNSLIFLKILTSMKIIKIFKIRNKQKNITFNCLLSFFSENYSLENFLDNLIDGIHSFLAFHFFICLNIFIAKQTYPNWLITINTQDENLLYNYIISCYSLTETLTTVGYGDVVCQSLLERVFQIFFLGVGVIAYSYIISSFGNIIKNERLSSIKFHKNMEILEKVIEIVATTCEVDKSEVTGESTVGDFPAWDSMGHLAILNAVEEAFDISFEPEEMMEMEDVNDIVKAVEEKQ
jgi:acyl carrier protein